MGSASLSKGRWVCFMLQRRSPGFLLPPCFCFSSLLKRSLGNSACLFRLNRSNLKPEAQLSPTMCDPMSLRSTLAEHPIIYTTDTVQLSNIVYTSGPVNPTSGQLPVPPRASRHDPLSGRQFDSTRADVTRSWPRPASLVVIKP